MENPEVLDEILKRLKVLEEKVESLLDSKKSEQTKMNTEGIKTYIDVLKQESIIKGEKYIDLVSNDIHNNLKLKSRMPMVCNAMRQSMKEGDIILHQTASGNSSTLKIRYILEK